MEKNKGPYFVNQLSGQCGDYYPDVLLAVDALDREGKINRITFCFNCNKYFCEEMSPSRSKIGKEITENFSKGANWVVYSSLEELAKFREEKLKSFIPGSDW